MKTLTIACALGALCLATAAEAHPRHGYGHGGYHNYAPPVQRYAPPAPQYDSYGYPPRQSYAPVYGGSYSGHRGGHAAPAYRPYSPYGYAPYAYGYNSAANGPVSEGYNFGYSGGPTFGMGRRPVINGVRVFGPPR